MGKSMSCAVGDVGLCPGQRSLTQAPVTSLAPVRAPSSPSTRALTHVMDTDMRESAPPDGSGLFGSSSARFASVSELLDNDKLAAFAMLLYCAVIPLAVLCSLRYVAVPMFLIGILVIILDVVSMSRKDRYKDFTTSYHRLLHDFAQLSRSLGTTLLPMTLAYFGGASFYMVSLMQGTASGCRVAELSKLAESGYLSFACVDGYVAADLQVGVPAWKNEGEISQLHPDQEMMAVVAEHHILGGRRLAHIEPMPLIIGNSPERRYGFVAPIFTSEQAYYRNEQPVAWAVKAGQPVRWSECDDNEGLLKTCGLFAHKLWTSWEGTSVVPNFGASWGFNITHFHPQNMLHARNLARQKFPDKNLGSELHDTFVVAEAPEEYFGPAYPLFWITVTLLCLGFFDHCSRGLYNSIEECRREEPHLLLVAKEEQLHQEDPASQCKPLAELQ
eukprot:TRINITY_DN108234_c0_g1_i1.p1 TRINITY_DN108234_c0_g1~~TRINITY_DN108234_c0_g1_i1.p1  ORF type:complete len:444 (+),score=58.71 TRINITY_DN108234_c0_g1_i1:84-1415(+)